MKARMLPLAMAVSALLGACAEFTAPATGAAISAESGRISPILTATLLLMLTAPAQIVEAESPGDGTEQLWFQAHLIVSGGGTTAPPPKQDGAILIVAAADGPMPSGHDGWLIIVLYAAELNTDGTIRFEGEGVIADGAVRTTLPVSGTVVPHSSSGYARWEINTGSLLHVFNARSKLTSVCISPEGSRAEC